MVWTVDHKEDADWIKGRWFGQVDHKEDADWMKCYMTINVKKL